MICCGAPSVELREGHNRGADGLREHAWSVEVDLVEDTVAEGVPVGADDNVTVDDGLENPTGLAESAEAFQGVRFEAVVVIVGGGGDRQTVAYPVNKSGAGAGAAAVMSDFEDIRGEVVVCEEPEQVCLVVAFHVASEKSCACL